MTPDRAPETAELQLITLDNGVRVALDPMPGLETAALGVWVRVGARWERAEENGIAHLFEHMAFKGAAGRDAGAFAEAMESVGGYMNASTSFERTSYTARIVREHAPFALDLVADMILDPHWRAEDLELEKNVVSQERGEAFDQPDDFVFELHQAQMFPDQPLGRPILGLEDTVAAVTTDTLRAFRDDHLAPQRVVIAVAGGFDRDAVLDVARKRFGGLAARPSIEASPAAPKAGAAQAQRKLEQTHLVFSVGAPAAGDEAVYAFWLLSEIFGGGMASRLFQEVREKRGLVYTISSWIDSYEDVGRLGVYAGCAAGKAKDVAAAVASILHDLAERGVTPTELARAKAVVSAATLMGAEGPLSRAESRAAQTFLRGRLLRYADIRARIAAVTADDLRAAARFALTGPVGAAVLGPKSGLGAAAAFTARFG
jgi:predicted Zn-dependent peptidase